MVLMIYYVAYLIDDVGDPDLYATIETYAIVKAIWQTVDDTDNGGRIVATTT